MVTHKTNSETTQALMVAFLNTHNIGKERIVALVNTSGTAYDVFYVDA